jgi:hypothetical protein
MLRFLSSLWSGGRKTMCWGCRRADQAIGPLVQLAAGGYVCRSCAALCVSVIDRHRKECVGCRRSQGTGPLVVLPTGSYLCRACAETCVSVIDRYQKATDDEPAGLPTAAQLAPFGKPPPDGSRRPEFARRRRTSWPRSGSRPRTGR